MRFIVVDGLDGAGKDTHALLIKKKYLDRGESVILRTHPSDDNKYGLKAKKALLGRGKINKIFASVYYAGDVIRSIRLYNKSCDNLIMVRYLMGVAYLPLPLAKIFYNIFALILPTSNYMFFLDVEPEESLKRLSKREEHEMFENMKDLSEVREKQLNLSKGWHIINTCGSIEDVHHQIDTILDDLDQNL
jgi:dTMP kinase